VLVVTLVSSPPDTDVVLDVPVDCGSRVELGGSDVGDIVDS